MTIRIAATLAWVGAFACGGGGGERPPAPAEPIGNTAAGSGAPVPTPTDLPWCEHIADAELPFTAGAPAARTARGMVVDASGAPIDGASVTIGGGSHTETRNGHTVTVIHGLTTTWTQTSGGFRFEQLQPGMDRITVEHRGITVRCARAEDDVGGYVIRIAT